MVDEILSRLYRIEVPLPGNPLKAINSYVLTSDDRTLVIDTGMNRPECLEVLEAGLDAIGVDLERTDFVATHLHADHQGLIATLARGGSRAFMGALDVQFMSTDFDPRSGRSPMGESAGRSGFPADELEAMMLNHPGFKYGPGSAVDFVPLKEGDGFEVGDYALEVVSTPGHTPGHVCLYEADRRLLFSGDHVLGDITPNIQAWSSDDDSLDRYLRSLAKVDALDVDLCLPGHRSPIERFHERIAELIEHHHERAAEVVSILETGSRTGYETAAQMSWDIRADSWEDFPLMQRWFATGEAIAHLRYLEGRGRVRRRLTDGQVLYSIDSGS